MKKVMIIDDEMHVLSAVTRLLKRFGWQVVAFDKPEEALDYARQNELSVVVSDYRMPLINGVEFFNRLNRIQPLIYKVMLSGQADHSAMVSAINQAKIHHFINKPWDNSELIAQLNRGLDTYKKRRQAQFRLKKKNLNREQYNDWCTEQLEQRSPGITKVSRNAMGWIEIDESQALSYPSGQSDD